MASTADSDAVRRLLYGGSTRSGSLSTGDIDWFVDTNSNLWLAASEAAMAEAGAAGSGITRKKVGDLEIEYSAGEWTSRSKTFRRRGIAKVSPYAGGISVADKASVESDSDRDRPEFYRGIHDLETAST